MASSTTTTSTRQLFTLGGATLLTAALGYCVYFDYKRRNDPVFRKKLLRDHRKVHKATKVARASAAKSDADVSALLKQTVQTINAEPFPTTTEAKEEFFMEQAGIGEMLTQRLPQGAMPAAIAFFKAFKVYPAPQQLLMIYEQTMPREIFMLVVEMIKLDVAETLGGGPAARAGPSGTAVLEEIPTSERQSAPASTSNSGSSGEKSSPPGSAPSETGSGNGHSFVIVDDGASAVPSVAPPASEPKVESLTSSVVAEAPAGAAVEKVEAGQEPVVPDQEPLS